MREVCGGVRGVVLVEADTGEEWQPYLGVLS